MQRPSSPLYLLSKSVTGAPLDSREIEAAIAIFSPPPWAPPYRAKHHRWTGRPSPPSAGHVGAHCQTLERCSRTPHAWSRRGDRAAPPAGCFFLWAEALGRNADMVLFSLFQFLFWVKNFRNSFKILKYIENEIKLRKIWNKFILNLSEYILAIGLSKLHFVHHGRLEHFYKSNLGVFIYKNT
jgi:hypothetical protein